MKFFPLALAVLASAASATSLRGVGVGVGAGEEGFHVVVPGALREMSASDKKIFKETLTSAYKEAFAVDDIHFTIEKADPLGAWGCTRCRRDDDAAAEAALHVSFAWGCTRCRRDDDSAAASLVSGGSPEVHSAWEKSFCNKLAKTGAANFANVRDCRIYTNGDDAKMES